MVTSWPPSSMALISRPVLATSRLASQRRARVAGRLQRVKAGARSGGERRLGAGEKGGGDEG